VSDFVISRCWTGTICGDGVCPAVRCLLIIAGHSISDSIDSMWRLLDIKKDSLASLTSMVSNGELSCSMSYFPEHTFRETKHPTTRRLICFFETSPISQSLKMAPFQNFQPSKRCNMQNEGSSTKEKPFIFAGGQFRRSNPFTGPLEMVSFKDIFGARYSIFFGEQLQAFVL